MLCPQCGGPLAQVEDDVQGLLWDCVKCGITVKWWSRDSYTFRKKKVKK